MKSGLFLCFVVYSAIEAIETIETIEAIVTIVAIGAILKTVCILLNLWVNVDYYSEQIKRIIVALWYLFANLCALTKVPNSMFNNVKYW